MRTPEQKRIAGIKQRQVTRQRLGHDDEKFHEINWLIKRIEELECVCDDDGQCLFHKQQTNKKGKQS